MVLALSDAECIPLSKPQHFSYYHNMISHLLTTTVRQITRNKVFSLINIVGLATGVAVCLLIGKYIAFESSYDKFHAKGQDIYRVTSTFYTQAVVDEYDGYDLGPALVQSFPEIETYARIHGAGSLVTFTKDGQEFRYREPLMLYVDNSFLEIFSFKVLQGDASTALRNGNSIILTESIAKKYFGNADPLGKVIQLHDGWTPGLFEVSAVIQDKPANSHFNFEFLLPIEPLLQTDFYRNQHQRWDNFHTYVQLRVGVTANDIESKIPGFISTYRGDDKGIDAKASLEFQPLLDIHYSPDLNNPGTGRITIYLFGAIAIFVLAIAWINYINLSTARAVERAREVGVKKAIGATKKQLIVQFFFESALVNLVSVLIAAGLALVLLPTLNNITGRSFSFDFSEPAWLFALSILFLIGTLVAGAYPALVLSSFRTTEVIKGKVRDQSKSWSLRNGLVGFQFACSLLLLVATSVIFRQVYFMQSQDKEFNTKHTVIVKGPELSEQKDASERISSFRSELLQYPFVSKVATSFSVPGYEASLSVGIRPLGRPLNENRIGNVYYVDPYFMDLYGIALLSGKTWDPKSKGDLQSIVINEEAVHTLGLKDVEAAVGETLILPFDTARIIGVVKNHHWSSMKRPYSPMIFYAEEVGGGNISVQLNGNDHAALETIEKKYKSDFPGDAFSYYFVDDYYRDQYREEEVFGELFTAFSVLAVLIGCLGLWGLAAFTTLRRKKEISIRKTLGASAGSVTILLVRQFLKPLFIGGVIVLPLAWMAGQSWLERFPYRIAFSADILLLPLLALLLVALFTVSYQTLRVAHSNPVDSLKE
jgi:putative ABC transport system permease protein